MSGLQDETTQDSTDGHAHRSAGQPAARAQKMTPSAKATFAVILLVVLAVCTVVILRSRTTLALGKTCGTIFSGQPGTPTSAGDRQVDISCFVQAYARCSAASLDTALNFGDGSTHSTFVVVPGRGAHGTCGLVVEWSTQLAGGGHTASGQENCAGLSQKGNVLTFHACGDLGDVQVPPGP